MFTDNKFKLVLSTIAVLALCLFAVACAPAGNAADGGGDAQGAPISVENDTVDFGDLGTVTDPTAGEKVPPTAGSGVEFDSLGTAGPADPYVAPGDLESLTLGIVPPITHGSANGDGCLACHESGSGGAHMLAKSHTDAGLTDEYCRNCHTDA